MKKAFINGKIYLEREQFCQAVLAEDGIIKAVDSNEKIKVLAGPDAEIIDLGGKTMIPGFNDSHMHLMMVGEYLARADVSGSKSLQEVIDRCKKFAEDNPELTAGGILGNGWMEDIFTSGEKRHPDKREMNQVSDKVPVFVRRSDGHVAAANDVLIAMVKAQPEYAELVEKGLVELDEQGEPTGFFKEAATTLCEAQFPKPDAADYASYLSKAAYHAASFGITSVQSNDVCEPVGPYDICFEGVRKAFEEDMCPIRYSLQTCFHSPEEFEEDLKTGQYSRGNGSNPLFKLGPLKLICDGSLGGRTALMLDEYCDKPGTYGVTSIDKETLNKYCGIAAKNNISTAIHCIGDGAVQMAIEAFEAADPTGTNPNRNAIVHCQVTSKEQTDRIVKDNIYVMAQPVFLNSDMRQMETRVSHEKCMESYAFGSMHRAGAHVSYGTDSPVEHCNPFAGLYCAVTRKDFSGWPENGWNADECVDIYDAVDGYTIESAWAEFEENRKGRIKPGYLADFTVCDRDIFTCAPEELLEAKAVMTVVGGKVIYKK
ncbi:MAG: amidohydrolase [Clostridia bacterium]|nr:amidohydrolase [Clostridia bacterium]